MVLEKLKIVKKNKKESAPAWTGALSFLFWFRDCL
jgi:hypothetical protein